MTSVKSQSPWIQHDCTEQDAFVYRERLACQFKWKCLHECEDSPIADYCAAFIDDQILITSPCDFFFQHSESVGYLPNLKVIVLYFNAQTTFSSIFVNMLSTQDTKSEHCGTYFS